MALHEVVDNIYYTALSTDIADSKIADLNSPYCVGKRVYLTNTKVWKIVNDDYTLSDYIINSDLQVADIQIGAVEIKDASNANRTTVNNDGSLNTSNTDIISGTATSGSKSTIVDTTKNFITNMLTGAIAEVDISTTKYFRKVLSNTSTTVTIDTIAGNPASASIGSGDNGVVTVTSITDGIGGNSYTVQGLLGVGVDVPMSVLLTGLDLVVTLGTNGAGTIDASKNTATLIAAAIDALPEFTAVASGTGADSINPTLVINFTGGVAIIAVSNGVAYKIKSNKPSLNTNANLKVAVNEALPIGSYKIGSINIRNNANDANIDPLSESTFTTRMGEVQATPTANTLLGRVKDLLTGIILSAGNAIIGKVGIDQTTDGTTNLVVAKQATHDNLNLNANMQVNNLDNAVGNPAFVQNTAGSAIIGSVGIDQTTDGTTNKVQARNATHDNFNANVNMQQNDTDIASGNALYVQMEDGKLATMGTKIDAPATTGTIDSWSLISMLKGIYNKLGAVVLTTGSSIIGIVKTDQTTHGTTDKVAADLYVGGTLHAVGNPAFAQLTAGTALAGKVGIDQVTANANEVVVKSITAGDNNIGNVDIVTLPSGNLGQQAMAASLSIVPANNIADTTYIGDIKFGEELPIGSNKIGSINIRNNANDANIDPLAEGTFTTRFGEVQATPTANTLLGRVKDLLTGIVLSAGSAIIGKVGIDQTTDGTTNLVVAKQATHDNLNLNANIQIGNTDVATGNPVPVDVRSVQAGTNLIGKISIDQVTANANEVVTKTGSVTSATLTAETTKVIGTVNNKVADGDDVALGAKADAAMTVGDTTPTTLIGGLKGIFNKLGAVVLAAGTAIIGKVGIDQTTDGTTNKVQARNSTHGDFQVNATLQIADTDNAVGNPAFAQLTAGTAQIGKVDITQNLIASTKTIEIQTHFAKNTFAGVEQTAVQIPKPTNPILMYKTAMTNSSIDSTLTVKLFNRRTFALTGTAQTDGSPDTTHIVLAATANPTNDHYNTFAITITAGTGNGQTRTISDYVGATTRAEVSLAWDVTPDNTSVYSIALVRDSLAWTGSFAKASLTAPIVKARDSEVITGLFDNGSDVYYVVSNDTLIADADASRFTAIFQLIPLA